jgi:O-methyltransferase
MVSGKASSVNVENASIPRQIWRKLYWGAIHPISSAVSFHLSTASEPEKRRVLKLVAPYTMVGRPRLLNAWDLVKRAELAGIEGAVVECGVFKGGTSAVMASAASATRKIWLFDSFEGLPEPKDIDGVKAREYAGGRSMGTLSSIERCVGPLASVHELFFDVLHIDPSRVEIRKGWFQDTVPKARHEIGPIAVLRLDGDWYESTQVCLEHLYDLVVPNGFVIIDDYGYWEGCRRAVDEFVSARELSVDPIPIDDAGVWWQVAAHDR